MRAIDADACESYFYEHLDDNGMAAAMNAINDMPTIEPQRKKGKWIEHNPHKWGLGIVFECSECGEKIDCEPSNFCPNCGAEMEGQDDSI